MADQSNQSAESSRDAPKETNAAEAVPARLDYEVLRIIGRGSYGSVWLVRDAAGAYCACKVVYREQFDHERPYEREYAGIQRFEPVSRANESQVKILHVGRHDEAGYFYYLMELGDDTETGQEIQPQRYTPKTLKSELAYRRRLPVAECIQIGLSLCDALENLHENGLIHRDIKPANIIFVRGTPKLADIGLLTEAGHTISFVGTMGFIPPEGPTSPQADLYALGKVLYEISTGMDRLDFPELPAGFGTFPDHEAILELNAVAAKACESDVRRRYQFAREIFADLDLLRRGKSIRRARQARRKWALTLRAALALVVLLAAAAGIIYGASKLAQRRTPRFEQLPTAAGPFQPDWQSLSSQGYLGSWELTIPGGAAGWLGVQPRGGHLEASLLWGEGSVVPLASAKVEDAKLIVTRKYWVERRNAEGKRVRTNITETITATLDGDTLRLVSRKPGKNGEGEDTAEFSGKRSPPMPPAPDLSRVKFGQPIRLFNGTDLTGWRLMNPKDDSGWKVVDGVLVNDVKHESGAPRKHYGNLRTDQEFNDLNLTLETRVPKNGNSGILLRGLYEIQVFDSYGKPLDSHNMGAIFSRIAPTQNAEKPAGEWQTMDMTLVDRHITVVLNGKKIIDNQPIEGCTGGALSSDISKPGPISLQGDHTGIEYRNIVIRPVVK